MNAATMKVVCMDCSEVYACHRYGGERMECDVDCPSFKQFCPLKYNFKIDSTHGLCKFHLARRTAVEAKVNKT